MKWHAETFHHMKPAEPASESQGENLGAYPGVKGERGVRFFLAHSIKVVPRKALFVLLFGRKGLFLLASARSSRREKT
ncbi:hypothetical protein DI291_07735 [Bacillus paralicheniformis]|nr:hypothetical protein DI291_07735 [Bacillus paralicheniformis]